MEIHHDLLFSIAEALRDAGGIPTCNTLSVHVAHDSVTLTASNSGGWSCQRTIRHQAEMPRTIANIAAAASLSLDQE